MQSDELVLGIDGGGTKTVAWLALCEMSEQPSVVGRGTAGPSNPQAVGFQQALENLDRAIAAAFKDAEISPGPVAAAVLGLAGSDRDENRLLLRQWADDRHVARRFRVVHDALPVLMAGTPDGWGVALICGTGSLAFGQNRQGVSARAGGWGYLFGDEGSGYCIALAGLRAAAKAADGRGPETELLPAMLNRLELNEPAELVSAIYPTSSNRTAIASLAKVVTGAAGEDDMVAWQILDEAAGELAAMVAAVAKKLFGPDGGDGFPVALAGGVLLGSEDLQRRLHARLTEVGLRPEKITTVPDPVLGSVKLAGREAARRE